LSRLAQFIAGEGARSDVLQRIAPTANEPHIR
jgi:hypothetical protein